jgi:hypothetical protein
LNREAFTGSFARSLIISQVRVRLAIDWLFTCRGLSCNHSQIIVASDTRSQHYSTNAPITDGGAKVDFMATRAEGTAESRINAIATYPFGGVTNDAIAEKASFPGQIRRS